MYFTKLISSGLPRPIMEINYTQLRESTSQNNDTPEPLSFWEFQAPGLLILDLLLVYFDRYNFLANDWTRIRSPGASNTQKESGS